MGSEIKQWTVCTTIAHFKGSKTLPKCNFFINVEGTEDELKALLMRMVEINKKSVAEYYPEDTWMDGTADISHVQMRYGGQLYCAFSMHKDTLISYTAVTHMNFHKISELMESNDKLHAATLMDG